MDNVLTNYATTDALASWARGAIALSLLAGYPFAFDNLRESALEALKSAGVKLPVRAVSAARCSPRSPPPRRPLLGCAAFAGATFGSAIIYVMPSIMLARRRDASTAALGWCGTWSAPTRRPPRASGAAAPRGRRRPRHHGHRVGVDGPRRRRQGDEEVGGGVSGEEAPSMRQT